MSAIPLHDLNEVVTKADLRAEIADLRTEMTTGFANLETKLVAKIEAQQTAMYRHVNRIMVAVLATIVGAMFGVGILT